MYETYEQLKAALRANIDGNYDKFNNPIVNSEYKTLGVRTPVVRKIAKAVPLDFRDGILKSFFEDEDKAYEDVLLAGLIAVKKGDYVKTREYLKKIIPVFGSWAHTDTVIPGLDWTDRDMFLSDFKYLLDCDSRYEVRAYIIYMFDCLTDERIDFVLDTLKSVRYGKYYVDMAAAWLLAECLVKFYDKTVSLFQTPVFPKFVHNKAIQKARESYRISPQVKECLKGLKV